MNHERPEARSLTIDQARALMAAEAVRLADVARAGPDPSELARLDVLTIDQVRILLGSMAEGRGGGLAATRRRTTWRR